MSKSLKNTASLLEFCDKDFEGMEQETEIFLAKKRAENEAIVKQAKEAGMKSIPLDELLNLQNEEI